MTFDVVRKTQYWDALDNPSVFKALGGFTLKALDGLKHIQDAVVLNRLIALRDSCVLEIGGGASRVLPTLHRSNERWNLDPLEGAGNGPTDVNPAPDVRLVRNLMGEFSAELPNDQFDLIFSISVIEHIAAQDLTAFWKDHVRVMKRGARAIHVIDLYLRGGRNEALENRIDLYVNGPLEAGLQFSSKPVINRPLVFNCDMASNSDWGMWRWNCTVPALSHVRAVSQSVTLWLELEKPVAVEKVAADRALFERQNRPKDPPAR